MSRINRRKSPYYQLQTYLSKRDHTVAEIRKKLQAKQFSAQEIQEAITWAQDKGYLNDEAVTQRYIEQTIAHRMVGSRWLALKLQQKGVAPALIQHLLEKLYPSSLEQEQARQAAVTWQKRHPQYTQDRQRLGRFLQSRGFGMSVIQTTLETLG